MSEYKRIFTDGVKDVIGNDPVVDQFDVSYVASFYGSSMDDFVTGTMLTKIGGVFSTGSRGRAFSKFYASSQPNDSSADRQSIRAVPWKEKVSNAYRISQHIDQTERYYDTCLPSPTDCFEADESNVWIISGSESSLSSWLSPRGNVDSTNVGYLTFNYLKFPRTGYSSDPLVNNSWTWSYPYESKYNPEKRKLRNDKLGLESARLKTTTDFSVVEKIPEKRVDSFFPILPGRLSSEDLGPLGKNGLRPLAEATGLGPFLPSGSSLDRLGNSYLIPSDIFPNTLTTNTAWGPAEFLTGTMTRDDMIKFLFGFGDVNNMTHGLYKLDMSYLTTAYTEGFEYYHTKPAKEIPTVTSDTGSFRWENTPSIIVGGVTIFDEWFVIEKGPTPTPPFGNASPGSNYISASYFPSLKGVSWQSSSNPSNSFVLGSNTSHPGIPHPTLPGVFMDYQEEGYISTAVLDVTCSNPWQFSYSRAVHADPSDFLFTCFAGYPTAPAPGAPIVPIDYVTGANPPGGPHSIVRFSDFTYPYMVPPGEYRIAFNYVKTANSSNPTNTGLIDRAFIDNVTIKQLDVLNNADQIVSPITGTRIGGNNYPEFHQVSVDNRYNPLFLQDVGLSPGANFVTASADIYASYNFGIAPIIRGWKYGLYSGLPQNSKAIFRRDKFGQIRDMLEQRQYAKFINDAETEIYDYPPTKEVSLTGVLKNAFGVQPGAGINPAAAIAKSQASAGPSPVNVKFVKQEAVINEKGVGYIKYSVTAPENTYSQNLSVEATSSMPYFDDVARSRSETSYTKTASNSFFSLSVDSFGNFSVS